MVRTTVYLGLWFMASELQSRGHQVLYLDEVVRSGGLAQSILHDTTLDIRTGCYRSNPLDISLEEYRRAKNADFTELHPRDFVARYGAFREDNVISRVIATTGNTHADTLQALERFNPHFVCVSLIASANIRAALSLGKAIADNLPRARLVYGGQHVTAHAHSLATAHPWINHLVTGDGITALTDLVEGRSDERVLDGGFQPLERFPTLDLNIIAQTGYPVDQQYSYPSYGRRSIDFMFSKGCFRACEFCVAGGQEGNYLSAWDWETVEEQFKMFREAGIEELVVQDDAFLPLRERREVLETKLSLIKKYGFYWQNSGGIDFELLDDDVTDLLIAYNRDGEGRFTGAYIPFNPRRWNRGTSATRSMVSRHDRCFENLRRLRQEGGAYVFTSDIIGTPEHSRETVRRDIQVHKEMITDGFLDAALTLSATMLPGTSWFRTNGHNIISQDDAAGYSLFTTHHRTHQLSPSDIEELVVLRTKELNAMQDTYNWQTAFPNSVWVYN
jgi:hypothetical protein